MEKGEKLKYFISLIKGGFPGFSIIEKQMNNNSEVKKRRVGFILTDTKAPAREGVKILTKDDKKLGIGAVTSGSPSPTLGKPIGMAYVKSKYSKVYFILKI